MTAAGIPDTIRFRDIPVDVLRGLAITIMVGANLVPYLLAPPAPFWLRLVSSLAAPLFIFLSGMMVALSCQRKHHPLSYFLLRGGFVIGIAALLDLLVLGTVPFTDTDVLYLIGISLPLAFVFLSLGLRVRLGILITLLAAAPLLREGFGYGALPLMIPLVPFLNGGHLPGIFAVLSSWFIDGWFPVFPWLFVFLLGAQAGMYRWHGGGIRSFAHGNLAVPAAAVLAGGSLCWYFFPGPQLTRLGYVELFYPPATGFLLFVSGLVFCLFFIADSLPVSWRVVDPIRALGECSLALYILHITIIQLFIQPLGIRVPLDLFLAGYLLLTGVMVLIACILRYTRQKAGARSFVVRALVGG